MLIAWDNLADTATATATDTDTGSAAANVQHAQLTKVWRSSSNGNAAPALIFDMGSSKTCSCAFVGGCNMSASGTVRIRSSDLSSTVTANLELDSGTVSAGIVAGYGSIYKTFTATNSRYWRIDLDDDTMTATKMQVGRVFLGPHWTPAYGQSYGWSVQFSDASRQLRSYGGQTFVDARARPRLLTFSLDFNNEAEMFANAWAMQKAVGLGTDILAIPQTAGSYIPQQSVWGLLTALEPIVHERVGIFRQKFQVLERL